MGTRKRKTCFLHPQGKNQNKKKERDARKGGSTIGNRISGQKITGMWGTAYARISPRETQRLKTSLASTQTRTESEKGEESRTTRPSAEKKGKQFDAKTSRSGLVARGEFSKTTPDGKAVRARDRTW